MAETKPDTKSNEAPPAVPAKEPLEPPKDDAPGGSLSNDQLQAESNTNDDMPPRSSSKRSSHRDTAASGSEKKDVSQSKPKPKAPSTSTAASTSASTSAPITTSKALTDIDRDLEMIDLEASNDAMANVTSLEDWSDAPSYQLPARKASLPPTAEDIEPEDDETFRAYEQSTRRQGKSSQADEENTRLRRHVNDLSRKLSTLVAEKEDLRTEKQFAEEKAEAAVARMTEMKQNMTSGMTDIERDTESLASALKKLKDENKALREQLSDAQSHIFSLQPYRKDLTPEEVGREYDNFVESIQDWVQKFMDPWLENHEDGVEGIMLMAKKRPSEAGKFKRVLQQYPDLVHASMVPETDIDIIVSIILRYLHDHIFQAILYGAIRNYTEVVSFIENSMQMSVEPKRDLFSVRTWTAEAYNALLSSPPFRSVRDKRRKEMTVELGSMLKIFIKKDKQQWFLENLDDNCILPAMELYEKMQVSTHHFYLDINPFISWGGGGDLQVSPEFVDTLKNLDCQNVLQNRKAFNLAKLDPPPSKKELYHRLLNVCTVVPALYMRQVGQKDSIKEPTVVRKQQMLVAWGPEEKRRAFLDNGDRPIVSHLYLSKNERSAESWVSSFRLG